MMKKIILSLSILVGVFAYAQEDNPSKIEKPTTLEQKKAAAEKEKANLPKPYHPEENAAEKLEKLMDRAQEEGKNIMIQAGGNWCIWCRKFEDFRLKNSDVKELVDNNYYYYHLNFSPENKNEEIFAKYDNPGEKFGYPVFLVLNPKGELIHVQDSAVLEEGNGYSVEKVIEFLKQWTTR